MSYYRKNENLFKDSLDKYLQNEFSYIFIQKYTENDLDKIKKEIRNCFDSLLDHIPYVGGDDSQFTANLIEATIYLSVYKVLINREFSLEEVGRLINEIYVNSIERDSEKVAELEQIGEVIFSNENIEEIKRCAIESRNIKYEKDFIVDFVEGNNEEFDFGSDTHQCPIHLYFKEQNSDKFTKYVCNIDFIRSKYLKSGLQRKKCLSNGDSVCEFRWKRYGEVGELN